MKVRLCYRLSAVLLTVAALLVTSALQGGQAHTAHTAHAAPAFPRSAQALAGNNNPFCSKLGHSVQASQGAQMYCFGPQQTGPAAHGVSSDSSSTGMSGPSPSGAAFSPNVDAANV